MEEVRSQIIQADHVVKVMVRKENRVDGLDRLTQCLFPEVWTGVDQDRHAICLDEARTPQAPVLWINGATHPARAPDYRYSGRCTCSQ
jgi:hypothetical protein